MSEQAIRNPKTRGKSHRLHPGWGGITVTFCGNWARDMTERIPVEQTAPEDRCRRCWPALAPHPSAHAEQEGE